MIFRQLFDHKTYTYTYLLAEQEAGKALLIDPVIEKVELYQQLINEFDLQLCYAIDTHLHADHITALGRLRELYGCETVHGKQTRAHGISSTHRRRRHHCTGQAQFKRTLYPGTH